MTTRAARIRSRSAGAFGVLLLAAQPAAAITAEDVMKKMEEKERFGYITGLIDMLSYQAVLAGNRARAECITRKFYSKKEDSWRLLYATFDKFGDKSPEGLVVVFANRACGG